MRAPSHQIGRLWASDWSLTALLALLVALMFVVHPLIGLGYDGLAPLGSAIFSLALVSGVFAVTGRRGGRLLLGSIALVAIGVHWTRYTPIGAAWAGPDAVATFIAGSMLAAIVFVQVFRPGPITHHRIQGALAAYLLIALMFSTAYVWIDLHSGGGFSGAIAAEAGSGQRTARLVYFSLTTLTTVGYGDIVPVHPFARSLAMLEALVGQVFPAVLLAGLVSTRSAERQRRGADDEHR